MPKTVHIVSLSVYGVIDWFDWTDEGSDAAIARVRQLSNTGNEFLRLAVVVPGATLCEYREDEGFIDWRKAL